MYYYVYLKRFTFRKPFRTNISNFLSCLPFSHASIINILISLVSWKYYYCSYLFFNLFLSVQSFVVKIFFHLNYQKIVIG